MAKVYSIFAQNMINGCTATIAAVWVVIKKKRKELRALKKALWKARLGLGDMGGSLEPRRLKDIQMLKDWRLAGCSRIKRSGILTIS